ncbi:hypothetical protein D0Y65_051092 [Glycine soja]|uniref:Uncharacterized protein n=1 Tax=Glycine soja TaxID=3848 RepID=A0A445FEM9_GLYSO|nr:hypothetical protein D0Y65_051092 [Glycine soja]
MIWLRKVIKPIVRDHCSCPIGWLGRLLFFCPTQSLKLPTPKPFFCCVFPSYNPIASPSKSQQKQLKCCELETLKIETRLGDQKRRILKTDIALKKRVEPTEVARKPK